MENNDNEVALDAHTEDVRIQISSTEDPVGKLAFFFILPEI